MVHLTAAAAAADETLPPYWQYFLAMTHHRLGHANKARESLDGANERAKRDLDGPVAWNRRLTLELLQNEAETLLANREARTKPDDIEAAPPALLDVSD